MACEHCHYFRGLKGTPFGRCYNHPTNGEEVLFDDNTNLISVNEEQEFFVNRFATYICETAPHEPKPWEEPYTSEIN